LNLLKIKHNNFKEGRVNLVIMMKYSKETEDKKLRIKLKEILVILKCVKSYLVLKEIL